MLCAWSLVGCGACEFNARLRAIPRAYLRACTMQARSRAKIGLIKQIVCVRVCASVWRGNVWRAKQMCVTYTHTNTTQTRSASPPEFRLKFMCMHFVFCVRAFAYVNLFWLCVCACVGYLFVWLHERKQRRTIRSDTVMTQWQCGMMMVFLCKPRHSPKMVADPRDDDRCD